MRSLVGLVFVISLGSSHGYILADEEPDISWPEEYHFNGEEINLVTNIVKTFEYWYSTKHNRSRIDLYGGTVSRYYYGMWYDKNFDEHDGKIYMFHPEAKTEGDEIKPTMKCEMQRHWDDQRDFLPPLEDLEYAGTKEHDGKTVLVYENKKEHSPSETHETLYVEDLGNGVGIPVHHFKRRFDLEDGSLASDITVNYYNYHSTVDLDDLDASKLDCSDSWDTFPEDFDDAVKRLHPSIRTDVDMAFHRFKRQHKRDYVDEEHHTRREIFKRNWEKVIEHNRKQRSYKMGLNQFADKTAEELRYLNGVRRPSEGRGTHPFPHTEAELGEMAADLPDEYDLRSEGVISPVKNQAHCGSCWAFAMAATVEGALARKNGGRLINLSEQSLVDCAWDYQSYGCGGTMAIDAVFDYAVDHGLPTDQDYGPYLEEDGICKISNMTQVVRLGGYVAVTRNSPSALKAAIFKHSPVTIGVLVTRNMALYKSGVFYDLDCEQGPMNHAVTLVGYGSQDGAPYWLVKNSWGEAWGEDGYIRISAQDNNCNVMTSPYYPIL